MGKNWYVENKSFDTFLVTQEYAKSRRNESLARERVQEYQSGEVGSVAKSVPAAPAVVAPVIPVAPVRPLRAPEVRVPRPVQQPSNEIHTKLLRALSAKTSAAVESASSLSYAPGGFTSAALQTAHIPVYTVTPLMEFAHKLIALMLTLALVLGTYAAVDPQYARYAIGSMHDQAESAINSYRVATGGIGGFADRAQQQVAIAAENPQVAAAGLAGLFTESLPNMAADLARALNTQVNDLVYAIAFPQNVLRPSGIAANSSGSGAVSVEVQPYAAGAKSAGGAVASTQRPSSGTTTSGNSIASGAPTIINNYNTIQEVSPQLLAQSGGITQAQLNEQLNQLDNKLSARMYSLTSAQSTVISQNYNVTSQSNAINKLVDVTITNPTLTGGSISGTSVSATGLTVSGDTSLAGATLSGNLTVGGSINLSATSTSLTAPNAVFTNATSTNFFATLANITTGVITNLTSTIGAITNLTVTNSTTTNAYVSNASIATASTTNLTFATAVGGNATTTNFFATTASSTNLFASTANFGTLSIGSTSVSGLAVFGNGFISQASSTIGNGTQAGGLTINGGATTTGNLYVGGNSTVIGNSTSNLLTINSSVNSHLIPNGNKIFDLGSPAFFWRNIYVDTLTTNFISAASTSIGGTNSNSFTVNADNATPDNEDMSLIFFRGTVVPNAVIAWNSATSAKRFEFNQASYFSNLSGSTTQPTFVIKGVGGQTGDIFQIASSSGTNLFTVGSNGATTIGGSLTVNGALTTTLNASTTLFSSYGPAYFGSTATSTFDTTGFLTLPSGFFSIASSTIGNGTQAGGLIINGGATTTGNAYFAGNLRVGASVSGTPEYAISAMGNSSISVGTYGRAATGAGIRLDYTGDLYSQSAGADKLHLSPTATSTFTGGLTIGTSQLVVQQATGNVGIGTTSPTSLLSLAGSTAVIQNIDFTDNTSYGKYQFSQSGNGNALANLQYLGSSFPTANRQSNLELVNNSASGAIAFRTSGTEVARVTSAGFFGIGTSSPQSKLHVDAGSSNGILTGLTLSNDLTGATTGSSIDFQNHSTPGVSTARIIAQRTTNANSNSTLQFWNFFNGSLKEAGRFSEAGNFGIGTTSPFAQLSVAGASGGTTPLFAISTSTSAFATTTALAVDSNGNFNFGSGGNALNFYNTADQTTNYERVQQYWSGNVFNISTNVGGTGTNRSLRLASAGSLTLGNNSTQGFVQLNGSTATAGSIIGLVSGSNTGASGTQFGFSIAPTINQSSVAGYTALQIQPTETTLGSGSKYLIQAGTSTAPNLFTVDNSGNVLAAGTLSLTGLTTFASGFISQASSTIGNGTQTGGLTINGGATTTGQAYFAGNVGVGTKNPQNTLQVGNAASASGWKFVVSDGTTDAIVHAAGGLATFGSVTNHPVRFLTNGVERVRIDTAGNVGIGTTSPSASLQVENAATAPQILVSTSVAGNSGLGIRNLSQQWNLLLRNDLSQSFEIRNITSGTDPFVITTGGNVGIGTTSPALKLEVAQDSTSNDRFIRFSDTQSGGRYWDIKVHRTALNDNNAFQVFDATNGVAPFSIWGAGVDNTLVLNNGKVGIGTTTPWALLSLVGSNTTSGSQAFAVTNSASTTNFAIDNAGFISAGASQSGTPSGIFTIDASSSTTTISNLSLGNLIFDTDAGNVTLSDIPVDSNAALGVQQSQAINIGGTSVLTASGISNGSGGVTNLGIAIGTSTPWGALSIWGADTSANTQAFGIANSASTTLFSVFNSGVVGIATSSPTPNAGFSIGTSTYFANSVGIGTASPNSAVALDVGGNLRTSGWIASTGNLNLYGNVSSSLGLAISTAGNITVGGIGNSSFAGNLGIGTTSPYAKLSVAALSSNTAPLFAISTSTASATSTALLVDSSGNLSLNNGATFTLGTTPANTRVFTANGSLLINTGSSATTHNDLNIGGIGGWTAGESHRINFLFDSTPDTPNIVNTIESSYDGVFTYMNFRNFNNGGNKTNSLLTIRGDGNIGIGTTSPSALLALSANSTNGVGAPTTLFTIASTTAGTATSTLFSIDNQGNLSSPMTTATSTFAGGLTVGNGSINYDLSSGLTSINNLQVGAFNFDSDAGIVNWADMPVTSASAAGTVNSYSANINGNPLLTIFSTADGAGGLASSGVGIGTTTPWGQLAVSTAAQQSGSIPLFSVASTTNASLFTVLGNGNVGIGTSTPQWPLDIFKSDSNSMRLDGNTGNITTIFARNSASQAIFGLPSVTNGIITGSAANDFAIRSNQRILFSADGGTTGHMVIQNSGNVGIGTTSPYAKFSISANSGDTNTTLFSIASSTASATTTLLSLDNTGKLVVSGVFNAGGNGFNVSSVGAVNAGGGMSISGSVGAAPANGTILITPGAANRNALAIQLSASPTGDIFRALDSSGNFLDAINSNGNLAIGTSTAWAKLTIWGGNTTSGSQAFNVTNSASTTNFAIDNAGFISAGASQSGTPSGIFTIDASSSTTTISNLSIGNINFDTDAGMVALANIPLSSNPAAGTIESQSINIGDTPVFTVYGENDGATASPQNTRVGIGTTSPAYLLDVYGFINTANGGYKQEGNTILYASTTNFSTFVGQSGGTWATATSTLTRNTAVGYQALNATPTSGTASSNTAVGYQSLLRNTTGGSNAAFGDSTLSWNTTGGNNAAFGVSSLFNNTTGTQNIGNGPYSLYNNTTGGQNTANGYEVSFYNGSATSTVAIGFRAAKGTSLFNAQGYTAIGTLAGTNITTGADYNTLLGYQAGYNITAGSKNINVGSWTTTANANITTGSNNIIIGNDVQAPLAGGSNQLNIGNLIFGTGLSGTGTTIAGNIGIGTTTPTGKFAIHLNNGETYPGNFAFNIASSTPSATTTLFSISNAGQVLASPGSGTAPGYSFVGNTAAGITTAGGGLTITSGGESVVLTSGYLGNANSNRARFPTGPLSATVPALTRGDDTTTGFGLAGSGALTFISGGSEIGRFTSAGNFGIGTSTPSSKLEVNGDIKITAGSGGKVIFGDGTVLSSNAVNGSAGLTSWGDINFQTGGVIAFQTGNGTATSSKMVLTNSGNFGIGNTGPTYTLDVSGVGHFTSLVDAANFVATSSTATSTIGLGGLAIGTSTPSSSSLFTIGTSSAKFYVDRVSGNIGFGTASPADLLDINSGSSQLLALTSADWLKLGVNGSVNGSFSIFSTNSNYGLDYSSQGTGQLLLGPLGSFAIGSGGGATNPDVNISRLAAGKFAIGTGVQGSAAGTLIANTIGIGTTTPFGKFAISLNSGETYPGNFAFNIASSTASATTTLFSVSNNGLADFYDTNDSAAMLRFHSSAGGFQGGIGAAAGQLRFYDAGNNLRSYYDVTAFNITGGAFNLRDASSNLLSTISSTANGTNYINNGGNLGLGTTSPYAKLSISANSGDTNTTLFAIASSTPTATSTFLAVNNIGQTVIAGGNSTYNLLVGNTGGSNGNARLAFATNNGNSPQSEIGIDTTIPSALGIYGLGFYSGTGGNMGGILGYSSNTKPALVLGTNAFNVAGNYALVFNSGYGFDVRATGGTNDGGGALAGLNAGTIGIGTTSPTGKLAIQLNNGETYPGNFAFNIASSTASATTTLFSVSNAGVQTNTLADALTNAIGYGLVLNHTTSGTAAANFGSGIKTQLQNGSGSLVDASEIDTQLTSATAGSESSQITFRTLFNGGLINTAAVLSPIGGLTLNSGLTTGNSANVALGSGGALTFSTGARFTSPSAANIHLGAADAASAVAQTLGVQGVVAGTSDTAGANFTIAGSQGTGLGAGGSILFQTAPAGTTGSTQNALVTAMTINGAGLVSHGSFIANASSTIGDSTQTGGLTISGGATTTGNAYFAGKLGIGTASPANKLQVNSATQFDGIFLNNGTNYISKLFGSASGNDTGTLQLLVSGTTNVSISANASSYFNGGNVGIATSTPFSAFTVGTGNIGAFNGAICADNGGLSKCYGALTAGVVYGDSSSFVASDLAENYPTKDKTLAAGEIIALDQSATTTVSRAQPGGRVFGVVSTQPGVLLGDEATSSVPVALAGRVPVKVNLDGGPIAVGDPITVSTVAGVGMKATTTAYTIGIALDNYTAPTASSSILVFIQPELSIAGMHQQALAALAEFGSTTPATVATGSFMDTFLKNMFAQMTQWFASASNGITKLFAGEVHTGKLCVSDGSSETCVTKAQLDALLAGAATASTGASSSSTSGSSGAGATTSATPVISLAGNNPAHVAIGASYVDLGASITGPGADVNLGISAAVDGGATTTIDAISIDTSTAGTHKIVFSVTDQSGLTGTATRTVIVDAPASAASSTPPTSTASSTPPVSDASSTPPTSDASSTPSTP